MKSAEEIILEIEKMIKYYKEKESYNSEYSGWHEPLMELLSWIKKDDNEEH